MVPTFTTESIDEGAARLDPDSIATPTPQFFDVAAPPDRQTGFGVGPHRTSGTGHALHTGPYPSGLSRLWTYGASDSGSSRTPSHHCLPDPSRLTVPARPVRCQGCSHHRVRSHVLAAPSFTSQLRLTSSGVLSPPLDSLAPRGALSGSRTRLPPLRCGSVARPGRGSVRADADLATANGVPTRARTVAARRRDAGGRCPGARYEESKNGRGYRQVVQQ
jgi:hypothetical protein